jgi:hypothetical protein
LLLHYERQAPKTLLENLKSSFTYNEPSSIPISRQRQVEEWILAKEYDMSRPRDLERLKNYADEVERKFTEEGHYILVPFFGIRVDTNDIGLLSGITFVAILLMLWYSLVRALSNLRITFAEARKRKTLVEWYQIVSMYQVLTIPPERHSRHSLLFRVLPKSLFLLPALIQIYITWSDIDSWIIGASLDTVAASAVVLMGFLFFGFIVVLTYHCFMTAWNTDIEWKRAFDESLHADE